MEWWSGKILSGGNLVEEGFEYNSANNINWLSTNDLQSELLKI